MNYYYISSMLSSSSSNSCLCFAGLKVINKTRPITWLRALSLLRQTPTPSGHGDKTLMRGSEDRLATDSTDRFPVAYKDWRSIRLVTSVLITSFSPSGVGFVGVGRDATLFPKGVRAAARSIPNRRACLSLCVTVTH